MSEQKKARVAIYVRVSTLHQIDKDSLPMQKGDLIKYAKFILGTDDIVIYEDAGYSGKNTSRPKLTEMMEHIRSGAFTHLLVWKIDRISRNLLDFATMYDELKSLGVAFVSKTEQFDTSTAIGEAMLKIIMIFAELERNMTSERVTATMISRAKNGSWNGGRIPFGYDYDGGTFSINEKEFPLVRLIHDFYEREHSLVKEAKMLNEFGYRTRAGNEWSPVTLLIILRSRFYCGEYQYNRTKDGNSRKQRDLAEWVTISDHHPAIVSKEQKDRIISILSSNSKLKRISGTKDSANYTHIFANILYCDSCSKMMGASPASAKKDWQYSKYSCSAKRRTETTCKSISDPVVGEFVFNYILNMMNAQKSFNHIKSPEELKLNLLKGDLFRNIKTIDPDGLNDMFNMLLSGVEKDIYAKDIKYKNKKQAISDSSLLRTEKQRLERAIKRITDLYLYSDEAMTEREYINQKKHLTKSINQINRRLDLKDSSDSWEQSMSDESFISTASKFIISQKLLNKKYVSYKRLATSVDPIVLKSFIASIIDRISIDAGVIKSITFKNGLSHKFIYK